MKVGVLAESFRLPFIEEGSIYVSREGFTPKNLFLPGRRELVSFLDSYGVAVSGLRGVFEEREFVKKEESE